MIRRFLTLSLLTMCLAKQSPGKRNPHIVFIMADDLGWNDVGWQSSDGIRTPNIDSLLDRHSVLLNNSYVSQLCSPTRSAFLTGYYPYRLGTQHGVFMGMEPAGVPTNFTFFPQLLRRDGYSTHLVGKWHLGYCKEEYLPTGRGFESFYGYYLGAEDYFNHSRHGEEGPHISGLDFWRGSRAEWGQQGRYSTEVFAERAEAVVAAAAGDPDRRPLFLYLAFQAVHSPLEVPAAYLSDCHQTRKDRRTYCGMVRAMDDAVGRLVAKLKATGLYQDTVIIFSNDNGGQTRFGGNNYPLRGNKDTLWEGGTRAVAFLHAPGLLPTKSSVSEGLFSIVDWFPTILRLAGVSYAFRGDGVDQWDAMAGRSRKSPRKTLVYNIYKRGSGVRQRKYKLLAGDAGPVDGWIPPSSTHSDRPVPPKEALRLFDLKGDPLEERNLVRQLPSVVRKLKRLLLRLRKLEHPGIHRPTDSRGNPANFNGTYASGWC